MKKIDDIDKEILALLVNGKTAKEIGGVICRSPRTVETRISKIKEFYKASNTKHLIGIISSQIEVTNVFSTDAEFKANRLINLFGSVKVAMDVIDTLIEHNRGQVDFWKEVKTFIKQAEPDNEMDKRTDTETT